MHPNVALSLGIPMLIFFSACSEPKNDPESGAVDTVTAVTLGAQSVRPAAEYLSEAPYANASRALGERLASQCKACHTLNAGAANMLGPNLHGLFGRRAGSVRDFDYSDALADADFVWTPRALDAWLARPDRFLPGNTMVFPGIPHAEDRAALIARLLQETEDKINQ